MKVSAIESIEKIFQKLNEDVSLNSIPRENLEKMFEKKQISDKNYQIWNNLLKTKTWDEIKTLMLEDGENGEVLRNNSIFTRIY